MPFIIVEVLKWFQEYTFEKCSESLGDVKMTVTQIQAGKQHNAIPSEVTLVVDVRVNDRYSNKEIAEIIISNFMRLNNKTIIISSHRTEEFKKYGSVHKEIDFQLINIQHLR